MYRYALLDENNVCHTVYESSDERNDFNCKVIQIETYDEKYMNARWDDTLNDWEFPPTQSSIWVNDEWVDINPPIE